MLAETTSALTQLTNLLPQIAIISAICGFVGWSLRGLVSKPAPAKTAAAAPQARDRSKNLEAALEKSKDALKILKSEHEALKASAVSSATLDKANAELDATRKSLDSETKRISTLETDLKKAQDTIKNLNSRANDADKVQKDRSFALENELSKARQALALLEARPDDSAGLHTEIERLRESVAVSTRYAGEMRKREAAAIEALEKAQAQVAEMSDTSRPAAAVAKKIGPVGDSDRVAAAKAEVLRLLESNKQAAAPAPLEIAPAAVETAPASAETPAAVVEAAPEVDETAPALAETTPTPVEEAPAPEKKPMVHGDLFAIDQ